MIYELSLSFTHISETSGTIQNASHINTIELSTSNQNNSGILLYPLQSISFHDQSIYLRGVDGAAQARVIPFELGSSGASSSLPEPTENDVLAFAEDMDNIFDSEV